MFYHSISCCNAIAFVLDYFVIHLDQLLWFYNIWTRLHMSSHSRSYPEFIAFVFDALWLTIRSVLLFLQHSYWNIFVLCHFELYYTIYVLLVYLYWAIVILQQSNSILALISYLTISSCYFTIFEPSYTINVRNSRFSSQPCIIVQLRGHDPEVILKH